MNPSDVRIGFSGNVFCQKKCRLLRPESEVYLGIRIGIFYAKMSHNGYFFRFTSGGLF